MNAPVDPSNEQCLDLQTEGAKFLGKAETEMREASAMVLKAAETILKDLSVKSLTDPKAAEAKVEMQLAIADFSRSRSMRKNSVYSLGIDSKLENECITSDRIAEKHVQTVPQRVQWDKLDSLAHLVSKADPKFDMNLFRMKQDNAKSYLDTADACSALQRNFGRNLYVYKGSSLFNPTNPQKTIMGLYEKWKSAGFADASISEFQQRKVLSQDANGQTIMVPVKTSPAASEFSAFHKRQNWAAKASNNFDKDEKSPTQRKSGPAPDLGFINPFAAGPRYN